MGVFSAASWGAVPGFTQVLKVKGIMQARERLIERRKSRRVAVKDGHVSFLLLNEWASLLEGDALLLDISLHGCRLESEQILPVNQLFQLILYVPSYVHPLLIQRAMTRWIEGHVHGFQFIDLYSERKFEFRSVIRELSTTSR